MSSTSPGIKEEFSIFGALQGASYSLMFTFRSLVCIFTEFNILSLEVSFIAIVERLVQLFRVNKALYILSRFSLVAKMSSGVLSSKQGRYENQFIANT